MGMCREGKEPEPLEDCERVSTLEAGGGKKRSLEMRSEGGL